MQYLLLKCKKRAANVPYLKKKYYLCSRFAKAAKKFGELCNKKQGCPLIYITRIILQQKHI
jgi:hypothetical protein